MDREGVLPPASRRNLVYGQVRPTVSRVRSAEKPVANRRKPEESNLLPGRHAPGSGRAHDRRDSASICGRWKTRTSRPQARTVFEAGSTPRRFTFRDALEKRSRVESNHTPAGAIGFQGRVGLGPISAPSVARACAPWRKSEESNLAPRCARIAFQASPAPRGRLFRSGCHRRESNPHTPKGAGSQPAVYSIPPR